RDDDLSRARGGGLAAGVPAHRPLADGEHAEGAAACGRARHRPSGVARMREGEGVTARPGGEARGYELIWAETDDYVGKVLFVRNGHALSLQYHEVKDESWYVQSGRAALELGTVGGELEELEIEAGDSFRFRPRTVHRVTALED